MASRCKRNKAARARARQPASVRLIVWRAASARRCHRLRGRAQGWTCRGRLRPIAPTGRCRGLRRLPA
eukprot:scaffold3256_cov114-Isochrysis_galbana.AAC.9